MRILFITHYSKLYGANYSLLQLIKSIKKNYNDDILVLVNGQGPFTEELEKIGVPYLKSFYVANTVNVSKKFYRLKAIIKLLFKPISYWYVYRKLLLCQPFDIIHSNSSVINIGNYLSKKLHTKHVWHIREYGYEDYNLKYLVSRAKQVREYEESDAVIAISKSIYEMIRSMSMTIPCEVIYNGVEQNFEPYEKKIDMNTINFAVVGKVCENKNQLEAIQACKILKEKGINNFRLYVFGDGDRGYKEKIQVYVEEHELEDYIKLMGYSNDIVREMKNMNVGIVTSLKEAFGRVTIEFMSNYMPVIGTNTGGTVELINNNNDGIIYTLNSIKELADAMESFILSAEKIKIMGIAAERKSKQYTADINAQKIHELYMKIL